MEVPPPIPNSPAAPQPPRLSFLARVLNVFAIPGAVFEDVRTSRHAALNWVGPILFAAIAMTAALWLTVCQPAVLREYRLKLEQNIAQLVADKKMEPAQADANRKMVNWIAQPEVARAISTASATAISALRVFGWGFVLWFVGRVFFKVRFGYGKALEVSGLASMISVLGTVVAIVLTIGFNPVTDAGAMARADSSTQTPLFIIVANVFNLWFIALLASGLARLTGGRFGQTLFPIMGIWLVMQLVFGVAAMAAGAAAR